MRVSYALSLLVLAAACGDDGHDVTPTLIPGGGVTDPGIDGELNVYVIDGDSDAPIAGAGVLVGEKEGVTDSTGLYVATGVTGPQTVAIKATGYATSVWVGLDSANVTATLDRTPTPTTTPPHAELAGSITGWDAVPAPIADHFVAAVVTYSQSRELGATDNNLAPPPTAGQLPSNVCAKAPPPAPSPACAWRINARVGRVAVFAILIDVDTQGTATEADDTQTILGFASAPTLTVVDGADQAGLALTLLPAGSITTAAVNFGTPPAGLTQVNGIVGVDLGEAGVVRLSQVSSTSTSVVVPSLAAIPGSTYELLGIAAEPVTDGTAAESIVIRRGLTSASAIAAGDWLPPATGLSSDRATASFGRVTGASVHVIELDTSAGAGTDNRAMSIVILDDSATVTLPVGFAPLPTGSLLLRVNAIDAGAAFDPQEFALDDLEDVLARLAGETIRLN